MKYRAIVRNNKDGEFVVVQRKDGFFSPWAYFSQCITLEEADKLIKGLADGTVTTGIYNYDKAGNRKYEAWI